MFKLEPLILKWKLFLVKRKARKLYLYYNARYGDLDCGATLLQYMSPRAEQLLRKVQALCRLAKRIDAKRLAT